MCSEARGIVFMHASSDEVALYYIACFIHLTLTELSMVQSLTVPITQVSVSDVFGEVGLELTISNDSLSLP